MLRTLQLVQQTRPLVSLLGDVPTTQRHRGWEIGYLAGSNSSLARELHPLTWQPAASGQVWGAGLSPWLTVAGRQPDEGFWGDHAHADGGGLIGCLFKDACKA